MMNPFRIFVCGHSPAHYPRNETLMQALAQQKQVELLDHRQVSDHWQKVQQGMPLWKKAIKKLLRQGDGYLRRLTGLLQQSKPDAILVMWWNEEVLEKILPLAQAMGVPVWYDPFSSRLLAAEREGGDVEYWRQREGELLRGCDVLLMLTPPYMDYYGSLYGLPVKQMLLAPLAVEDSWLSPLPPKQEDGIFRVGYWGSFLKHHGVEVAFEAAKLLQGEPSIRFCFFGSSKIRQVIEDLALPNLEYLGWQETREDLKQAIDGLDAAFGHLLPLHDAHLVLPNKALEAMARGKVVLQVESEELSEIYGLPGREQLVFFADGAQGLASHILRLQQDQEVRQKIGREARKAIEEGHSTQALAHALPPLLGK